ncbi:MAG: hypothetical protein CM15mP128_1480 [Methanobacteriota archaeon]|nr:MAG: hypothetical protein CM15mP128_1480 [Euryarchaeota archaeon]
MLTFTPDGKRRSWPTKVTNDMYTTIPKVPCPVDFPGATPAPTKGRHADQLQRLWGQRATLATEGVRMFGPNANLSQDLEPEYIAVSPDGTHAMVVLQENNAFAKVDLTTLTVTDIVAMGMKDYSVGMYDFSDKDDGVNLATYANVYGMYQPDAISTFSVGGSSYYVTRMKAMLAIIGLMPPMRRPAWPLAVWNTTRMTVVWPTLKKSVSMTLTWTTPFSPTRLICSRVKPSVD